MSSWTLKQEVATQIRAGLEGTVAGAGFYALVGPYDGNPVMIIILVIIIPLFLNKYTVYICALLNIVCTLN